MTLGLSRAGRRMCSVLPGEAHGRFQCSLATFCGFLLLVFGRSVHPVCSSRYMSVFYSHVAAAFRCDVFVCFLVLGLIRIAKDQV